MAAQGRTSSPQDQEEISSLVQRAIKIPKTATAVDSAFQRWKYWDSHPLMPPSRSYLLEDRAKMVAHGCRWPIQVRTMERDYVGFQLIDWAADPQYPGAGLQVLRDTCAGSGILFFIGGTNMTKRVLPVFGEHLNRSRNKSLTYNVTGTSDFVSRPLQIIGPSFREMPFGWKTGPRFARNIYRYALPLNRLPKGYHFTQVVAKDIPEALFPKPSPGFAVSVRTTELFQHIASCPVIKRPMFFLLERQGRPVAYFFLVLTGTQVRTADYGPRGMSEADAKVCGTAIQLAAREHYPEAWRVSILTTEPVPKAGFMRSGFRPGTREENRIILSDQSLQFVQGYGLTFMDLDTLCLDPYIRPRA